MIQIVLNSILVKHVFRMLGVNIIIIHKHVIKYYNNHVQLYIIKLVVKIMDVNGMIQLVVMMMKVIVVNMKNKKNVNNIFNQIDNVYG